MSEGLVEMKTDTWGDVVQWDETEEWTEGETWGDTQATGLTPTLGDTFIVLLKDNKTFVGSVNIVENQDGKYFTLKNNDKSLLFQTEEDGSVKLKTDEYELLDIQRIKTYDMKLLEIPETIEEKYEKNSDIAYSLVDDKDRIYSKQELKEMLISTLYREYNDPTITKPMDEIIEYAEILLDISGETIYKKQTMGNWCIPIISNDTKIIPGETETVDEIKELNDNDMLITDSNTQSNKNYNGLMKNLLHSWDNILYDENNEGLMINDYEGKMYRNCLNMNNCSGINGLYSFDELKNNRALKIPTTFDRITGDSHFMELRKPMKVNVTGILTVPYHFFPFLCENLLDTDKLSLYEKCILQELMKQTNVYKRAQLKNTTINSKTLYKTDSWDYKYELGMFTVHRLDSKNKDELFDDIAYIKPSVKDILESLDEKIVKTLKSYQDITKLLINYEIDYSDLDAEYKFVNDILTKNTTSVTKSSKIFKIKQKKTVKKELTIETKIKLAKDIIFSMLNISLRNLSLRRFIDTFCIDTSQDKEWFIGIHDKKRLLCKHYSYLSKDTESSFFMMKQKYQMLPPKDGNIYCKNCGEFICQEEFSHDDGFSGDLPTSTKEILIEEKDVFEKYDESEMNNIALLKDISQGFGTDLKDEDLIFINDIYISLSEDIVANKRYDTLSITTSDEHPRIVDIKKTHKKDKKALAKGIKSFQIFLKTTNKIMVFMSLCLIIITINIPIYENKYIKDFKLFTSGTSLNKDFIGKIVLVMKKVSHTFGEKYDKIYTGLTNETKQYDVTTVSEQIHNLIRFFLTSNFPKILTRYEEYSTFIKNVDNVYVEYEWPVYKPLSKNELIGSINEIVQNDKTNELLLLKTYNSINVENVTGITTIDNYDIHNFLNIKRNELINTAFQRLFNISVSLYGELEKPSFFIDTNVEKLYNESNDAIKEICLKSGWNDKTKTMGPVKFKELRKTFIPNILNYIYTKSNNDLEPCFTLRENCNEFVHVNVNNYDLQMMNVPSKRFYYHVTPDIFPSVNYIIINDGMKDKLFKTFAFDPTNNVIKRENHTNYLGKFIIDITNITKIDIDDKSTEYEKNIPRNEKNFHTIISSIHEKSRLSSSYINMPSSVTVAGLKLLTQRSHFSEYQKLLEDYQFAFDSTKLITLLESLELNKDSFKGLQKEITDIFLQIENTNDEMLATIGIHISQLFKDFPHLREGFQSIFIPGKKSHIKPSEVHRENLEKFGPINYRNLSETNIEGIFRLLIEDESFDFDYLKDTTNEILYIISNVINSGYKNPYIPKSWRLSDTNKEWFKKYVETHYFSHHRDIYKKNNFKDFSKYFGKSRDRFIEMYKTLKDITKNIEIQRNTTENVLSSQQISLWKNIYLSIINELLHQHEEDVFDEEIKQDIENIESFSLELITHLLEKRYDTTWVYSNKENLSELLGFQKEREKQKLIHKLDGMSNAKRHATTELHTIGTKNHFKASELDNMEHIEDTDYKNEQDDYNYINQLMNGSSTEAVNYVIEDDLTNDNYDTGEIMDDDGGNMG